MEWYYGSWICWRRRWRCLLRQFMHFLFTGEPGWSLVTLLLTLKWYVFTHTQIIDGMESGTYGKPNINHHSTISWPLNYTLYLRTNGKINKTLSYSINAKKLNNRHLSLSVLVFPQLKSLSLPDCWIKDFFMAHMYTELQMIKEALQKYQNLIEAGFSKSTYIISQIAVAYHNIRG